MTTQYSDSMTYLLSIIIPVYQVEKYIEECLDSVFLQLPPSVEIIIVNDGTSDHSVEIIVSRYGNWLEKDQVVLIEQENAGPGAARNRGLSEARGEYVGFLDSDDVLLESYFSIILKTLNTYNVDIIEFGFRRFHELSDMEMSRYESLYTFEGLQELDEVRNELFSVGIWFPCTRVYQKEIFEDVRFPVGVFYEDLMTIPYIYLDGLTVYFVDQPLIGYRLNPNSTTALHTKSHAMDMYAFYMSLTEIDSTIAIDILRIKTARGIIYFYNELGTFDFPIIDVLRNIRKIKKRFVLLKCMRLPDLFFFISPRIYMWMDRIRLYNLKRKCDNNHDKA